MVVLSSRLDALHRAESDCTRCPLHRHATQVVSGEGPPDARLVLVGEQPGSDEDLQGRPFVGPAGRLLDHALARAGLDRGTVFLTNAVKHFKFEQRGKRRLHQRPNAYEVDRCRWWLEQELALVRPKLVVALGVTAARGLLKKNVTLSKVRGKIIPRSDAGDVLVTVHPSYLLRIQGHGDDPTDAWLRFVADLRTGAAAVARPD